MSDSNILERKIYFEYVVKFWVINNEMYILLYVFNMRYRWYNVFLMKYVLKYRKLNFLLDNYG